MQARQRRRRGRAGAGHLRAARRPSLVQGVRTPHDSGVLRFWVRWRLARGPSRRSPHRIAGGTPGRQHRVRGRPAGALSPLPRGPAQRLNRQAHGMRPVMGSRCTLTLRCTRAAAGCAWRSCPWQRRASQRRPSSIPAPRSAGALACCTAAQHAPPWTSRCTQTRVNATCSHCPAPGGQRS
jgi:hypothetical protein